jgi:outer membrane lipoprotein-sorting protein
MGVRAHLRWYAAAVTSACAVTLAQSTTAPDSPAQRSQPAADATLDAAMQAVDDRIGKIEDLRAKFVQRKSSAMLRKPIVSTGEVIARGEVVLWRTQQPRKADMRVGNGEIRLLYPDAKLLEIYPIGHAKGMTGGPLPRLRDLREQFTFTRSGDVPANGTLLQVLLTPRSEDMRRSVASVHVTIDTTVPCVTKIVMIDPDGEETTVEFTEIRINSAVTESDVALQVPDGTRESRPLEGRSTQQTQEVGKPPSQER